VRGGEGGKRGGGIPCHPGGWGWAAAAVVSKSSGGATVLAIVAVV
jgi:hypothetical protein